MMKKQALLEAVTNTAFGFVVSMFLSYYALPFFGLHKSIETSLAVVSIFTVASVFRNYFIRRIFQEISKKM